MFSALPRMQKPVLTVHVMTGPSRRRRHYPSVWVFELGTRAGSFLFQEQPFPGQCSRLTHGGPGRTQD